MNLPTLDVPGLLRSAHLNPKKKLGQNFLMDNAALQRVVTAAEIQPEDEVLEIGAGLGSLTRHLSQAAQRVVAVELDQQLVPILQQVLAGMTNVQIVAGDILEQNPAELMQSDQYLVVANIPLLHHVGNHPALAGSEPKATAAGADDSARGGGTDLRGAG